MASETSETPAPTDPAPAGGPPTFGRRAAFAGVGVAALGLTAAACGSGGGSGQSTQSSAPAGAPGTVLGPVSDVPVGGGAVFADQQVVVTQATQGRFQGLSTVCPHAGCAVSDIRDGQIICPCHGSRFGLDGAVLEGPASSPLARRAVAVQGTNVTLA